MMEPLDLRTQPPRSCYAELDGLMLMPRTIDKLRSLLPGGEPGEYFINGKIMGISGYLMQRLGVTQEELQAIVAVARDDNDVASWLRGRVDPAIYPEINATLRRIKPHHAEDPKYFHELYRETIEAHPELCTILEIVEADDARLFGAA